MRWSLGAVAVAFAFVATAIALSRPVRAAEGAGDLVREARALDDAGEFARALDAYRAVVAAAPDSPEAERAANRVAWLGARSEGDFRPLERLETVRRDPARASDPGAIDALARDAAAFPAGTVRIEARMFVAEAWLGRLRGIAGAASTERALELLRDVRDDPTTDPLTARVAERQLVGALAAAGRLDEAAAEASAHADRLDAAFMGQTRAGVRRRTMRRAATFELGAFGVLAAVALGRAGHRGTLGRAGRALRQMVPLAIGFAIYLAAAGGVLACAYESGNAAPFVWLGAMVLPLTLVARAWGAVGSGSSGARAGRALLCAVTVLAAALLALDQTDPGYLEGFGL
jgi:hypothetical protein